jgi:hypothetical protein
LLPAFLLFYVQLVRAGLLGLFAIGVRFAIGQCSMAH